ncbi:MAG TPA: hypothetical protein VFY90_01195, partial [Tepidiformaceae bacterium]|nr:hypothetical protein [Tepidiformaceae bacterium]
MRKFSTASRGWACPLPPGSSRSSRPTDDADRAAAIVHAVLGKLHQLPADAPNVLLVATGLATSGEEIAGTMRGLKLRA